MPSQSFLDLLAVAQLYAYERQLSLPEVFKGDWLFDMGAGTVTFTREGERVVVPVQVLGTESGVHHSWLWGWANQASGIPAELLQAAEALRDFGVDREVTELAEASVSLDEADGHTLAMVALHLFPARSAPGYYRCPYENGALFVLMADGSVNPPADRPLLRLTTVLPQVKGSLLHLHAALYGYADKYGLAVEEEDHVVVLRGDEGEVRVGVDGKGRLGKVEAHLG